MARDAHHHLHSPVDLGVADDRGGGLHWASVTIAVATITLLFANAGTLAGWVDEQTPSDWQLRASDISHGWADRMDRIGIGRPRAVLHARWKQAQAKRFGDEAPGENP
jgi:hypothetical protein